MPPTGNPVAWTITEYLQTTLEAVSAGSDYYNTIERVVIADASMAQLNVYPSVIIHPGTQTLDVQGSQLSAARVGTLELELELVMRVAVDRSKRIYEFIRDVDKALRVDDSVAGAAIIVRVLSAEPYAGDEADICGAVLRVEVLYRTEQDDLNTAV